MTEIRFAYQPRPQFQALHARSQRFGVMVCHRRAGKALDVATPILTGSRGWQTMGSVRAGDTVFDEHGLLCRVLQAHPVMMARPCYAVVFDDGHQIVADEDHLWFTQTKLERAHTTRVRGGGRPYTPKPGGVRTTLDIRGSLRARGEANHTIRLAGPLQTPTIEVPLDPYILGVWLGDGTTRSAQFTSMDGQIVDELRGFASVNGYHFRAVHSVNSGRATTYSVTGPRGANLLASLRGLSVVQNKHIPQVYLQAGTAQRRALLEGLMDTDGTIDARNGRRCEITQKNRVLAEQIVELARSLGNKVSIQKKVVNGVPYWRVCFTGVECPFRLERKRALWRAPSYTAVGRSRRIVSVEPVDSRPVRCLTVDSTSRLYLVGRALIPTHNTVAAINDIVAKASYTRKKRAQYAYIAPFYRQAKDVAWEYLKDYAGPAIAGKPRESELRLSLFNDATITLYGADNPDAFRGMYFDGVVIDEYGDMRPKLWSENVLPTLADRKGWAMFLGTPKGPNHFRDMWDRAVANPDQWFSLMLKASESGILSPEELSIQRAEMDPNEYEQEFECSFTAAVRGAVWADVLAEYEHLQRLDLPRDDELQVQVAMDIGSRDAAAAWVWQETSAGADMLFYHEKTGSDPTYWDQWLRKMGCGPEHVKRLWLPHDAVARTFATQRTTVEQFLQAGYKVDAVPRVSKADGLQAARLMVPHTRFSAACSDGLAALYSFKYSWDARNKIFSRDTEHTWASHGSDAFRYYSLVAKRSGVKAQTARPASSTVTKLQPVVWKLDDLWADYDKSRGSKGQILRIR